MNEIMTDLGWDDLLAFTLLAIVVLQHAGTAGIRAAMGRDGRIDHRKVEFLGAVRGTIALVVLLTPVALVWGIDALSSPERFQLYMEANDAMLQLWIPISVVALLSFVIARVSPWQVRSNINSMLFSLLELSRPVFAAAGMAIAAIVTQDWRVAAVGAFAVFMGMQVTRLTRRWWYFVPIQLEDLGPPPPLASQGP